jgi:hypothetical protein
MKGTKEQDEHHHKGKRDINDRAQAYSGCNVESIACRSMEAQVGARESDDF